MQASFVRSKHGKKFLCQMTSASVKMGCDVGFGRLPAKGLEHRAQLSRAVSFQKAPSCSELLLGKLSGRVRECAAASDGKAAEGCACFA